MGGRARNRVAERAAIAAAADRLLAGTPLRSTSGRLTATELIIESGLRRDVVYEHDKTDQVVQTFTARVHAQHAVPDTMRQLADDNRRLRQDLADAKAALADERGRTKVLHRVAVELALELQQAQEALAAAHRVTRLPARPAPAITQNRSR